MTQEAPNYVGWRPEYDGHAALIRERVVLKGEG